MIDAASLVIFATALAVVAGSPGPSIAALTARVLTRGVGSVLPFLVAMWVGEAVWLTCAVLGLSALAAQFSTLFLALKYAGVAYLMYLAWSMWRAEPAGGGAELPRTRDGWRMFAAGMAVTLGNPKIMVFYVALFPGLIDVARVTATGWAQMILVMLAVLAAVDLGWALAAARARRLLRSPRAMRVANRISATTMGGAAVAIAAK
jgi:threonine/homoserine/homoserine lactone efflux protein